MRVVLSCRSLTEVCNAQQIRINIYDHHPEILREVHIVNKTTFAYYHQVMSSESEMLSVEIKFHAPVKTKSMSEVAFHFFGGYLAQRVGNYDFIKKFRSP